MVYKETIIENSLYNSALDLEIKPNIIIEFARLYGFQVDFQRDIWKNDSFQIIYEEFINEENKVVDTGEIIFANLNLQNSDLQLYKYEYEKGKVDYFDENGKSIKNINENSNQWSSIIIIIWKKETSYIRLYKNAFGD